MLHNSQVLFSLVLMLFSDLLMPYITYTKIHLPLFLYTYEFLSSHLSVICCYTVQRFEFLYMFQTSPNMQLTSRSFSWAHKHAFFYSYFYLFFYFFYNHGIAQLFLATSFCDIGDHDFPQLPLTAKRILLLPSTRVSNTSVKHFFNQFHPKQGSKCTKTQVVIRCRRVRNRNIVKERE